MTLNQFFFIRPYQKRQATISFFVFLLFFISGLLTVGSTVADPGIVLKQVSIPDENKMLHLEAKADIRLPKSVRIALRKGVELSFVTKIQVREKRALRLDKRILALNIHRRLLYHALTEKYTVEDLTFRKRKSFSSLIRALNYLGAYQKIPLLDASLAGTSTDTFMRMHISLSRRELPLPLRLKSYISRPWYLSSDWYEWSFQ